MKTKILTILGALFLGALGSGLWEVIKPLFTWLLAGSLHIVTLGLDSLRDGLYAEAAAGRAEGVSITMLSYGIGLFGGITSAMALDLALARRGGSARWRLPGGNTWAPVVLVVTGTLITLLGVRVIYISSVGSHFHRLCALAAPFSDERTLATWKSRFAQTSTRQEFVQLTDEIALVAQTHQARVPEFLIF